MLVHARGKVSACFANVTGKFADDARTKPVRKRIFHVEYVLNFKSRINKLDEFARPPLCNTRKIPDVGD